MPSVRKLWCRFRGGPSYKNAAIRGMRAAGERNVENRSANRPASGALAGGFQEQGAGVDRMSLNPLTQRPRQSMRLDQEWLRSCPAAAKELLRIGWNRCLKQRFRKNLPPAVVIQ